MYLYFDKKGVLKTKIGHGQVARQGADLYVTVCLDTDFFEYLHDEINEEYSNQYSNWALTADLQKAAINGEAIDPLILFTPFKEEQFHKMFDSEITYSLKDGETYLMADGVVSANNSTDYGVQLRMNFELVDGGTFEVELVDNDDPLEEPEVEDVTALTYPLASAIIDVEKTYVVYRNNISPDLYKKLKQQIEECVAAVQVVQQNYVKHIETEDKSIIVTQNVNGVEETFTIDDALVEVDDELSLTSENPVQNKVITEALNDKIDKQFSITYEVVNNE